ncbi:MAG: sigma-54-dependent Fis family transcriptional regulator [Deltaproteobacteria bacterium]|nr:sigma-54-dependent Fis family transcriptional regulator [Deltaproteobacteria bacterium]
MNVLLVEDDNSHAELIQRSLAREGELQVLRAPNAHRALTLLEQRPIHVVVLDYSLPDRDGLDVLKDIRSRRNDLPVVFLTSADSAEICARALKGGAVDYVVKKRNYLDTLPLVISEACAARAGAVSPPSGAADEEEIVGRSAAVEQLRDDIRRAASSPATVLIEGETGTGKELVARAIHRAGARARGPFVPVNCAEIAEGLFESELFGHARGAFTGALADRKGLLESANGGTLLLDEIEDLPAGPQVKLLRVLQSREFKPVGTNRFVRFDARVIAASNQQISRLVQQQRFRADLFFRLDVLRIRVPALRERREDVPLLVDHAVRRFDRRNGTRFGGFSRAALNVLARRPWPGNVRELDNLVERTLVASTDPVIEEGPILALGAEIREENERDRIAAALERNRWNREETARELGWSRVTLWRRMARHNF